jgi:hypothetical protein
MKSECRNDKGRATSVSFLENMQNDIQWIVFDLGGVVMSMTDCRVIGEFEANGIIGANLARLPQ